LKNDATIASKDDNDLRELEDTISSFSKNTDMGVVEVTCQ